jgi:hypothetical protein
VSILTGYIHDSLNEALTAADVLSDAVLTVQINTGSDFDPIITDVPHACQGWRDEWSAADRVDGSVLVTDAKVYLLVSSLDVVPTIANTITIDAQPLNVINVALDAAGVAYVCQCRL